MTTEQNLKCLINKAAETLKRYGAQEVYVFGSIATSSVREGSDIDMAVKGLPPDVFFKAMAQAHSILGRPLDLIDLDEPNPLTRYLKEEGELVRVG